MKNDHRRFCVFCGKPPDDKNNEHVIPKWLIQLTGDPKRSIQVGPFINRKELFHQLAFDQFRFPACTKCNDTYASLEGRASPIMGKLLALGPVSAQDFDVLLDWFDKVRVGLWLGHHQLLDKNFYAITPNFYIADRIGTTDRLLLIYRVEDAPTKVNFIGVNTPVFAHSPTCFTLVVNNLLFVNISADFVLAKRAGLPYPDSIYLRKDNMMLFTTPMNSGTEKFKYPIVGYDYDRRCTIVAQPIFKKYVSLVQETYESQYVKDITATSGKAKPILQNGTRLSLYPAEESSEWLPAKTHKADEMLYNLVIQTLRLQIEMLRRVRVWNKEDKAEKRRIRYELSQCAKVNSEFIAWIMEESKGTAS